MGSLEAVLGYARRGWRMVRITPGGKAPDMGLDWPSQATCDPVKLTDLWIQQPAANIGVLCDRNFGFVLDVDDPTVLDWLVAKGFSLPRTLTARTPSGGYHFVFKHPEGWLVRCSADGKILERLKAMGYPPTPGKHTIDTRGMPGGQIVISPSQRGGESWTWIDDSPIAEAPAWLLDFLHPSPIESTMTDGAVQALLEKSPNRDLAEHETETLARICSPVFELPEGRYTAIYEAAIECGRARLPFGSVLECLEAAAESNGYKGKDPRGTTRQIQRGYALGWSRAEEAEKTASSVSKLRAKMGFAPKPTDGDGDGEFCSDPAAARCVLRELGGRDVVAYAESTFWTYRDTTGVWEELGRGQIYAATEMALAHHVFADKDKPETLTIPYMSRVREALALELTCDGGRGFFETEQPHIAVENGVLAVNDQGNVQILPHSKDYRLRFRLPVRWDPKARAPKFEKVLTDAVSERDALTLAEWWGATLFGAATDYQRLLLLVGPGGGGKSIVLNACASLFERLAAVPPDKLGEDRMVASLAGARLNLVTDISNKCLRDTGPLKAAVVGDVIQGRDVYKSAIAFRPRCGFAYSANELPSTVDTSDGFFRRFLVVPFGAVVAPERRIPGLDKQIIAEEQAGILVWMVSGYLRLKARGRFDADETVVDEWKSDQDWLAEFLRDCLEPLARKERGGRLSVEKVFGAYQSWAIRNGVTHQVPQKTLTRLVRSSGWVACKTWDNKSRALSCPPGTGRSDDSIDAPKGNNPE